MSLDVIQAYANMALQLDGTRRRIKEMAKEIEELKKTTIPEEDIRKIFNSYATEGNVYIDRQYDKGVATWYRGKGAFPTKPDAANVEIDDAPFSVDM